MHVLMIDKQEYKTFLFRPHSVYKKKNNNQVNKNI